jgi:hypothetical protein
MSRISDDLAEKIHSLTALFELEVIDEVYLPANFGNGILTLHGPDLLLRIIRDRGQLFIEAATPGHQWIDVTDVLRTLGLIDDPTHSSEFETLFTCLLNNMHEFRTELARVQMS